MCFLHSRAISLPVGRLQPQWRYSLSQCHEIATCASSKFRQHPTIPDATTTPPPSKSQLRAVKMHAALPMIGFGFMDQTIMIHAGNAIDCTIGVSLGISTLSAAAVGQILSNAGGIAFGETLPILLSKVPWLHPAPIQLTASQLLLATVERARLSGTFWGMVAGCSLGLVNLCFLDAQWNRRQLDRKSASNTISVGTDCQKSRLEIQVVRNQPAKYRPATTLTIRGPKADGIVVLVLAALQKDGCSILEMSAGPKTMLPGGDSKVPVYEAVFVVRRRGEAIPEEELVGFVERILWTSPNDPEMEKSNTGRNGTAFTLENQESPRQNSMVMNTSNEKIHS